METIKLPIIFLALFFGLFCFVKISQAANLYVDGGLSADCTTGNYSIANRSCTGSDGNAYASPNAAILASIAGDTINVRGAYGSFNGVYSSSPGPNGFAWTIGKNLTFQKYPGDITPIFHTTTAPTRVDDGVTNFYIDHNSTVVLKDLIITGTRDLNVHENYGHVGVRGAAGTYVIVDNCEVAEFNHVGIKGDARWWVKNSYIHDIGNTTDVFNDHGIYATGIFTLGNESIYEYNRFERITGACIQLYNGGSAVDYHIIRYNIMKGGGSANGSTAWGVISSGGYEKIYGNTIYGVNWGIMLFRAACHDNDIKNNILFGNNYDLAIDDAGGLSPPPTNIVSSNNYLGSAAACLGCYDSLSFVDDSPPNIRSTNNPFISGTPSTWTNFRLASSSAAINVGVNLGTSNQNALDPNDTIWPPSTIDQNSQGSGWEIGAFAYREAVSDTTPPAAPTGVVVQ